MRLMQKTVSIIVLTALFIGFTGSAAADLQCEVDTLSQKSGTGSDCKISSAQDITGESFTAEDVDVIIQEGGRIYTNHKTPNNNPVAGINLNGGDFKVKAGGAVHANINISAYNIKVQDGGVIDATGLGYQAVPGKTNPCPDGSKEQGSGHCTGYGPAGGGGGGGNSNTGAAGGGHAGKGGSFDGGESTYYASGGGRGEVKDKLYGTAREPTTFGSAGGAYSDSPYKVFYLSGSDLKDADDKDSSTAGVGDHNYDSWGPQRSSAIENASNGFEWNGEIGLRDDPGHDLTDSDRWISGASEYRAANPNDITMGAGGGRLKLIANNKLNNTGSILSNGLDGGGSRNNGFMGGGGAGGSLWVEAGGIFGDGDLRSDGGNYPEDQDGGDSSTGVQGAAGGGGGGYVYYGFTVNDSTWKLSADKGQGSINLGDKGFSGNDHTQKGPVRLAESGEVSEDILFSAEVNESVINAGEKFSVNGTAGGEYVNATLNGTEKTSDQPEGDGGIYSLEIEALDINETSEYGNYTLEVATKVSNIINTTFQVSHRTIDIQQKSDYILKPDEQFTVNSVLEKVKEDGSGGIQRTDYSEETVNYDIFSGNNNIGSSRPTTNSTGGFILTDTAPTTKGRKYYETTAENSRGIKGLDRKNLSWMDVNDTVVDPGQYIQINGTAHNTVYFEIEKPDGTFLDKGSVDPNSNGYFEVSKQSLNRSLIDSEEDLGNYTLRVQTELNGQARTETWEISHREIEIDNNPDFLLKADEDLDFSDFAHLIKEDGTGGSERVDYDEESITFNYFNQSIRENNTDVSTNVSGGYSVFHDLQPTAGLKRFTLETRSDNGITDTVQDNDLENINNRTLAWTGIDDYIVNSEEKIKVNGSAYNTVELIFNGTIVNNSVNPDPENGFFSSKFSVPEIQGTEALGNYTLGVNTSLNGKELSEKFEVSIRGIRFNLSRDYPVRVDPGENFTVSGKAVKYVPDGSGGSKPENYSNEEIKIVYRDQFGEIQTETTSTNSSGEFKIQDFESPLNAGDRNIEISTVNGEGIRHDRTETVKTRVRLENSSTTSPRKRLFKDSALQQTRFINPEQDVVLSAETRKSLDFVEEVYANVTLPNNSIKQVNLKPKGVLGKKFNSGTEWDAGEAEHLTHGDILGNTDSDQLRLGYERKASDKMLLDMPMETSSGNVKDVSGQGNDASITGSVTRNADGVFSTNATRFSGGHLDIDDPQALNFASNFTIGTWVKTTDNEGIIYSRRGSSTQHNPTIELINSGEVRVILGDSATATPTSTKKVNDGKWHYITARYNATHLSVFVDGNRQQSVEVGPDQEPKKFSQSPRIGQTLISGFSNNYNGRIDGFKAFNQSLSDSQISKLASTEGSFTTDTLTLDKQVKDILKLVNFKGDLNSQDIQVQVLSDYNGDGTYEENSEKINLNQGTRIRSVDGFSNFSRDFKLDFSFDTSNTSESPVLSEIGLKARKDPHVTWKNSKSIQNFFGGQYGLYEVDYGARDYGGNLQDTALEESSFRVQDIEIQADHKDKVNPGSEFNISGNTTLITGDGNGGKDKQDFTGTLNVLFEDTVRGLNRISESQEYTDIADGEKREVPVNGTQTPENAEITFIGRYSGIDEKVVWNSSQDWDSAQSRTGLTHSNKADSPLDNQSLTLGYSSKDLNGNALEAYYAMDDGSYPVNDSAGTNSLSKVGSPELGTDGLVSTDAVRFTGKEGLRGSSPLTSAGGFTVNAWVKPDSLPTSSGHLGEGTGDPYTVFAVDDKLALQITEGGRVYGEASVNGNSYVARTSTGAVEADEWTMVSLRYNEGGDKLKVSTNRGFGNIETVNLNTAPDLSEKQVFTGYRSDIESNSFKGKIDELRLYSRPVATDDLRYKAGDLYNIEGGQQSLTTDSQSFSETVNSQSLVLEADVDTRNQNAEVIVKGQGSSSDPIKLSNDKDRYQIDGLNENAQDYSLKVEIDSNKTHAPVVDELRLIRRYATEDPSVDIDGDGESEASINGRVIPGNSQKVTLNNLRTGVNTAEFTTANGILDAEIDYTEVLVPDKKSVVDVNSSGKFNTSFTVPAVSGKSEIDYFVTNSNGIQGLDQTSIQSNLLFTSSNVSDLENGDRTVDPQDRFEVNATLAPHTNDIERMWAAITTPEGNTYERDLKKSGSKWRFTENVSDIYDSEGNYTLRLNARDSKDLEELNSPQLSFNVTDGQVSATPLDSTVGLNREFTVEGTVRQNLTDERVNATVTAEIEGDQKTVETDDNGDYSVTLESPGQTGNYDVDIRSEDEDNITGQNTTQIEVLDSTSIQIEVPDSVEATDVGTEVGQNKTFKINISNTGETDARNIKIYSVDLPDEGDGQWISLNNTVNVSSGEKKEATAEVWIKAGSPFGTFDTMSLNAKFEESDGETVKETQGYSIVVRPNKRPLWQGNRTVVRNEGFSGSILSSENPLVMKNTGTSDATNVKWSLTDSRIKAWTKSYSPRQDPQKRAAFRQDLGSGDSLDLENMTMAIPNGTAPGTYSALLESDSDSPTETNTANVTVEVPNKPTYELSFSNLKDDVSIPEGEINMSNPIEAGGLSTGSTEKILDVGLINSGNRDLKWEVSREQNIERRILFDKSDSGDAEEGTEIRESDIKLENEDNYTYDVPDKTTPVYYSVDSNADSETYRANVTISCTYPIGDSNLCNSPDKNSDSKFIERNGKIILPLKGKIEDPAPEFTEVDTTPDITGVGNSVDVTAIVKDNKQEYLAENNPINATIKKNIEDTTVTEKKTDINIDGNEVNFDFTPTEDFDEGTEDNQEPDSYCISFKVRDSSGQTTTSNCTEFEVRESASPGLELNNSDITVGGVTASSGGSEDISGKLVGGEVEASNVNISLSTDTPSQFGFTNSGINKGNLNPGTNKTYSTTLNTAENIKPTQTFTAFVTIDWKDPDGSSRQPDFETKTKPITINIEATKKAEISHGSSDSIDVPHNTTRSETFKITSAGNRKLSNIQLSPAESNDNIFISGFNRSGFDLDPGETATIGYNITAEKYTEPTTAEPRDIEITYDSGSKRLNDTLVDVPEERSIETEPENISAAVPVNQGDLNISTIETKNTGNTDLEIEFSSNDSGAQVFFGQSKIDSYTTTITPGQKDQVKVKSDTEELSTKEHFFEVSPSPASGSLDSTDDIELKLFAQDIGFELKEISSREEIVSAESLEARFNLTQRDEPINSSETVDLDLETAGEVFDLTANYNSSTELWEADFPAPDIQDGVNHSFNFDVTSSAFRSTLSDSLEVSYKDVTPPQYTNLTAEPVEADQNSTLTVEVSDKSNILGETVTAYIVKPDETSEQVSLTPQSSERLSNTDYRAWKGNFSSTGQEGLYNVTVVANDTEGNKGRSEPEFFRVFEPLNVEGDAGQPSNSTEIRLVDQGQVLDQVAPDNSSFNTTVKSGTYEEARMEVTNRKVATLENFSASKISQDPPKFDSRISSKKVNVDQDYLTGYAVVSNTFEDISGQTAIDYSDYLSQIEYQGNLQVMKCDDYDITAASPCQSGYNPISKNDTVINTQSDTVFIDEIDGFSSYLLVENESSSTSSDLNVDLTGEIGNLSDLSNLDSILEEIQQNTQDIDTGDSGGAQNDGGGFSGPDDTATNDLDGTLENLSSQLNQSESRDLAIGNREISITAKPGQEKTTSISIQNSENVEKSVEFERTSNLENITEMPEEVTLDPGEFRTVKIDVDLTNVSQLRDISGFIQILSNETTRSIPFSVNVVSAENRLLDVSLEPTLNSFNPGQSARVKLSFSNQGFTRAVDAETTIKIVDIGDNETVAKETHTYAVQTTLDKVVSLDIPEETDLGTYEARASVEYSNIPGNRSATSVGQISINRPFMDRKTVGLQNSTWFILLFLAIIAASGGGYWYYRKKKLEEKRKRFEEQVDNEEIPDETGRTAFIGELSEIGTRAFVNLNDLKTHCLTAGATGAGKSVAAQVIVEEALEQGVNVIVLDPTGQWSGYLQENEDQQMEAFYSDFGMSESDERDYKGNIRAVEADQDTVDITKSLRAEDENEGSIHVFSMHKLENDELEEYLSDTIQQIFEYNPEEKDNLETLIVYDEAHRVLEKFGGTGKGVNQLERGAREFRKWGIGMVLISQVIGDFPDEVRANIGTQIQMRTEYEGDLDRIERKYGDHISQGVTKASTGTGMIQNSSYNHGRPYFVDFRPLKHSPERISDEQLDKFEKFNRRVDEISDMIEILDDMGEDVFDYRSRLDLAKKNIRKMSFNLADTYLEELRGELEDKLDM